LTLEIPPVNTIEETSSITKLSKTTIWRFTLTGELKATRVGKRVLITRQAIECFLKKNHDAPPSTKPTEPPSTKTGVRKNDGTRRGSR
jgi:excisionase family DNA binding protein